MQANHANEGDGVATLRPDAPTVPAVVDWIVAALAAMVGLVFVVGGTAVLALIDRELIVVSGAEEFLDATGLTAGELTDVGMTTVTWTGAGLAITGVVLLVAAVAYALLRRRAHGRRAAGEPASDFWANATVGAVCTVILSSIPFSPVLGGAIAGYFERGESERVLGVGAVSGLLAAAPLLSITLFVLGGLVAGFLAVDAGALALLIGAALLFGLMVIATIGAGLGALGGYLGGELAERRLGE